MGVGVHRDADLAVTELLHHHPRTYTLGEKERRRDYAWNTPFSTLEQLNRAQIPNDVAALEDRRFVTASETSEAAWLNEARVKQLTGSDPVTARYLFREYFEFRPVAKIWVAVNYKPRVRDDSDGFWRRVRLLPFSEQFLGARADKNLEAKLQAELPGILWRAIEGCLEWQRAGLQAPSIVTEATEEYRSDSDELGDFVRECCVLGPKDRVYGGPLFRTYSDWCETQGIPARERLGSRTFGERMKARFDHKPTRSGMQYSGIGLQPIDVEALADLWASVDPRGQS
jgi:putative DNA primase/helicase